MHATRGFFCYLKIVIQIFKGFLEIIMPKIITNYLHEQLGSLTCIFHILKETSSLDYIDNYLN